MSEEIDCRICDSYILIDERYPSIEEPYLIRNYHKCTKHDKICLSLYQLRLQYENCLDKKLNITYGISHSIINEVNKVNGIFYKITNDRAELIEIDQHTVIYMSNPCRSISDFVLKLGALSLLLEMNITVLRKCVKDYDEQWKSIKLLEIMVKERREIIGDTEEIDGALTTLRYIAALRNKLAPFHKSSSEAIELAQNLGIPLDVSSATEWQNNADILLDKFLSSLITTCVFG